MANVRLHRSRQSGSPAIVIRHSWSPFRSPKYAHFAPRRREISHQHRAAARPRHARRQPVSGATGLAHQPQGPSSSSPPNCDHDRDRRHPQRSAGLHRLPGGKAQRQNRSPTSASTSGGGDFSSALQRIRALSPLFIALVAASEKSGMMAKLLNRATAISPRRIRNHPPRPRRAHLSGIMLALPSPRRRFLLTFVLPKFTAIYAAKGAALPCPRRCSWHQRISRHDWPWLILTAIGRRRRLMAFLPHARRQTPLSITCNSHPAAGPMFRKLHLARGLRMIGTMAGAGISLVDCVKHRPRSFPTSISRTCGSEVSQQIQAGKQFSEPLFPKSAGPQIDGADAPQRRKGRQARPGDGAGRRLLAERN
jgi:hypothetical protein